MTRIMKNTFCVMAFLFLSFGIVNAQQKQEKASKLTHAEKITKKVVKDKTTKDQPNPVFETKDFDFGKINESDAKASTVFTFTNEGNVPFVIERAIASCGCTTPKYNKEPILPGKTGTITVTYSTIGRVGVFEKQIQLFTNVPYPNNVITLIIRGEVLRDT